MMYLNEKDEFVKTFFKRTKEIIEHSQNCDYDVTLLCNCLTGILVFPEQKFYNKIDDNLLSNENIKKIKSGLIGNKRSGSVKTIFKRMRNAVSRCNIKFESATSYTDDNRIKYIYFYDDSAFETKKVLDDYEFQLRLDVDDLKDILFDFCEKLLKNEKYTDKKEENPK